MSYVKYLIVLLFFVTVQPLYADSLVDVGLGVFNSGKNSPSETKFAAIGYQGDFWGALKNRLNLGGWIDNVGNGRGSSAFVAAQIGFEVESNGWCSSVFIGPALIGSPDSYLGGRFQFYDSLNFGIKDKDSNYIGISYRHISSAGIHDRNIGRDVLGIEIRF
jgi:hypothetical protein